LNQQEVKIEGVQREHKMIFSSEITNTLASSDFSGIANLVTIFSFAASVAAWIYSSRIWGKWKLGEQEVAIVIKFGSEKEYTLPVKIKRKNLTRAEIMGVLGLIPRTEAFTSGYKLDCLNNLSFFKQVEEAQTRRSITTLIIQCDKNNLKQFNI